MTARMHYAILAKAARRRQEKSFMRNELRQDAVWNTGDRNDASA
jgi:hypothetical protein